MTVQPIRMFSDPVLRTVTDPVTTFDRELRRLVKTLQLTLRAGAGRAGLAAPQIGVPLRVLVYELDGRSGHLVNPRLELSERKVTADEACLSAPGLWWPLERSYMVTARGRDMFGKPVTVRALGMLARVLQHETDHLDGLLFADRLPAEDRERFLKNVPF
ncbi:peptide deformylase [Planomonospora parontospora subsp. parontospora]|uniref:Peptide deformylase n=2 Tax=Planomonospora parontospora TaxID=58119 RepID=A0AA37F4P6_9ACTN|nr:peptide deformylase [Planomonospora parontospora]GGK66693.1 peptide deformylase [Planomonospora parontospora]GII08526.1 peptide deformylase [Planomonospora parontospora subsp. parontospora]